MRYANEQYYSPPKQVTPQGKAGTLQLFKKLLTIPAIQKPLLPIKGRLFLFNL
jgi:hypothetical protein